VDGEIGTFIPEIGFWPMLVRLLAAGALGLVIGIDREVHARPAGMRTHMLVCVAACTFTLVAFELGEGARASGFTSIDPTRVTEAVTAGVAFLAAGSIIRARGGVHGLTTGAGLWLAGAIGTACGVGAFGIAFLATLLGIVVLTLLRPVEKQLPKKGEEPPASEDQNAGSA
jgi:putative Mg2+ transporter-C (MgtC) family protein